MNVLAESLHWWRAVAWLARGLSKAGIPDAFLVAKYYLLTSWIGFLVLLIFVPPWLWVRFKAGKKAKNVFEAALPRTVQPGRR